MSNLHSSAYGGIATISVDDAVEIAELCMLAGRADRIAEFLGGRLTPGLVRDQLAKLAAPPTPAPSAASSATNIFGGPTPAQRDALTEAVRRRFAAMAAKPAGQ
jgi:hypothetical protein